MTLHIETPTLVHTRYVISPGSNKDSRCFFFFFFLSFFLAFFGLFVVVVFFFLFKIIIYFFVGEPTFKV